MPQVAREEIPPRLRELALQLQAALARARAASGDGDEAPATGERRSAGKSG